MRSGCGSSPGTPPRSPSRTAPDNAAAFGYPGISSTRPAKAGPWPRQEQRGQPARAADDASSSAAPTPSSTPSSTASPRPARSPLAPQADPIAATGHAAPGRPQLPQPRAVGSGPQQRRRPALAGQIQPSTLYRHRSCPTAPTFPSSPPAKKASGSARSATTTAATTRPATGTPSASSSSPSPPPPPNADHAPRSTALSPPCSTTRHRPRRRTRRPLPPTLGIRKRPTATSNHASSAPTSPSAHAPPDGIHQELYAFLTIYQTLTTLRIDAATQARLDPDRISFLITIRAIRADIPPRHHNRRIGIGHNQPGCCVETTIAYLDMWLSTARAVVHRLDGIAGDDGPSSSVSSVCGVRTWPRRSAIS